MEADKILDCKGLSCPEPILKIKKTMGQMNAGEVVRMQATDPGSAADLASWAKRTGNAIVDQNKEGDVFTYYVKKG